MSAVAANDIPKVDVGKMALELRDMSAQRRNNEHGEAALKGTLSLVLFHRRRSKRQESLFRHHEARRRIQSSGDLCHCFGLEVVFSSSARTGPAPSMKTSVSLCAGFIE